MSKGYQGKILRVDLSTEDVKIEKIDSNLAKRLLGGPGLAVYYLLTETERSIDPFDSRNLLIFMTGPLTGTRVPSSSRYVVCTKSPLTGLFAWSSSGGHFGPELKQCGFDAIIIRGKAEEPIYISVENSKVSIKPAQDLWGKTVRETESSIKKLEGEGKRVCTIGPAGESKVKYAAIMNDEARAAGRCGVGAVMGSKNLKAIAVEGDRDIKVADIERLEKYLKDIKYVSQYESMAITLRKYGTAGILGYINALGGLPTKNFQYGTFAHAEKLDGETLSRERLLKTSACFGCPISCSRITEVRQEELKEISSQKESIEVIEGPEYETVSQLGNLCGNDSIDIVCLANELCNELGMDTISTGVTIAFAMECAEKGLLNVNAKFGDVRSILELIEKIAKREEIGDLLAEGTKGVAEKIGEEACKIAMQVKGLEMPAYEPRAMKGIGLAYATSLRGACHITSVMNISDGGLSQNLVPSMLDPQSTDIEKATVLRKLEDSYMVVEASGMCKLYALSINQEQMLNLVNLVTGFDYTSDEMIQTGERIWNLIKLYNIREGWTTNDDLLPSRIYEEELKGDFQIDRYSREEFEKLLRAYYYERGWDEKGVPTTRKLEELGISEFKP